MKKIEILIECPSCEGSGVYQGIAEGEGTGVICYKCKGSGAFLYQFEYRPFTGRKIIEGIDRVYLNGLGYKLGLGKIPFSNGIGEIDMDQEGVSYSEFLNGEVPKHIKKLGCPMMADQSACHAKKGFVNKCEQLNGGWVGRLSECRKQPRKAECWKRFEKK